MCGDLPAGFNLLLAERSPGARYYERKYISRQSGGIGARFRPQLEHLDQVCADVRLRPQADGGAIRSHLE